MTIIFNCKYYIVIILYYKKHIYLNIIKKYLTKNILVWYTAIPIVRPILNY